MEDHSEIIRTAVETNRRMWNETAAVHERNRFASLVASFRDPGYSTLDELELAVLGRIGMAGKSVAQLSCNNGRELISVERLGATCAVGFDVSDAFIDQARRLAQAAGSRAEFVRTDVYEIESMYTESFDLVYVTVGAIGWMPDLPGWFQLVGRLLRPNGHLFIYEMHPVLGMFEAQDGPVLRHSYFRSDPFVEEAAPDYLAPDVVVTAPSVWFQHTLGDIVGGALRAGLKLEDFAEHQHDLSAVYRSFAELETVPPMSYHLLAVKQGGL
ncbi:MAG: class I SAM-dependent methyltransferase [Trueperaceae bacterium]